MDHGKLTDHNGKKVDFRNVILIMTTNAGASDLAKQAFGFNRSKREGDDQEAIQRLFTPEFRNRLDAIIPFQNLPRDVIGKVVEKFVFQLEAQLADRNVTIELSPEASDWLIEHGYDERFGARPMSRIIQEHIKQPLAEELLFGRLEGGGTVRVIVEEKEDGKKSLGFQIVEAREKPRKSSDDEEEDEPDGPTDEGPAKKVKASKRTSTGRSSPRRPKKAPPSKSGPTGSGNSRTSLVPKVPLA